MRYSVLAAARLGDMIQLRGVIRPARPAAAVLVFSPPCPMVCGGNGTAAARAPLECAVPDGAPYACAARASDCGRCVARSTAATAAGSGRRAEPHPSGASAAAETRTGRARPAPAGGWLCGPLDRSRCSQNAACEWEPAHRSCGPALPALPALQLRRRQGASEAGLQAQWWTRRPSRRRWSAA